MHDTYEDTERRLGAAQAWAKDHVPEDILDGWMARSKDMFTDSLKLREVRGEIRSASGEKRGHVSLEAVRPMLPRLYCAAYCFHLRTGSPLLTAGVIRQLAQLHAHDEVTQTLAHFEAAELGRWG